MAASSPTTALANLPDEDSLLQSEVADFSVTGMKDVADWVRRLVRQVADGTFSHYWAEVYLFGSSGLDAAIEGSDADLIVLSSINVKREFFFAKLPHLLRDHVENLTLVTAARVPLIKFRLGAVAVDIVFASVALLSPPTAAQLRQVEFLFTVSEEDRYNVNGIRTVLEIRDRVPVPYEAYATALKAVKRWATRREVYGNLFTFPNGGALAIMMARVCLMYNQSCSSSQLFRLFFSFFTFWLAKHDCVMPIFVTESMKPKPIHIPGMSSCWDAARETCREELIPVLNPAYPYVNAAHTVGRCGFTHFFRELMRANALLSVKAAHPLETVLSQVWAPYRITENYSHFVGVHVACTHTSELRCRNYFGVWKGLIESRLRIFVYALESFYDARPLPRCFERVSSPDESERPDAHCHDRHDRHDRPWCVIEGIFYCGIKPLPSAKARGSAGESLDSSVIRRCFTELAYAVEDSIALGANSGHGFRRISQFMKDPWFTLHHVDDKDFPLELCLPVDEAIH